MSTIETSPRDLGAISHEGTGLPTLGPTNGGQQLRGDASERLYIGNKWWLN